MHLLEGEKFSCIVEQVLRNLSMVVDFSKVLEGLLWNGTDIDRR